VSSGTTKPRLLRVGDTVTQAASVAKAEYKKGKVFVHQQRDLYTAQQGETMVDDGWAVREIRTHVFRPDEVLSGARAERESLHNYPTNQMAPPTVSTPQETSPAVVPDISFTYLLTSPLLFRYSAPTFNAHKVHYDRLWTRTIKGHPDLLVHGPLSATLLIELAGQSDGELSKFEYRAVKPIYVDREVRCCGRWVEAEGGQGKGRKLKL